MQRWYRVPRYRKGNTQRRDGELQPITAQCHHPASQSQLTWPSPAWTRSIAPSPPARGPAGEMRHPGSLALPSSIDINIIIFSEDIL